MSVPESHTYVEYGAATGEQAIIPVAPNDAVTVVITGTNTVDDVDLEFIVHSPGLATARRCKANTNVLADSDEFARVFNGAVTGVGIDINTNGSSNITFEVRSAHRGG